jgi:hypothetical protein
VPMPGGEEARGPGRALRAIAQPVVVETANRLSPLRFEVVAAGWCGNEVVIRGDVGHALHIQVAGSPAASSSRADIVEYAQQPWSGHHGKAGL